VNFGVPADRSLPTVLRLSIDVNIWIAFLLATRHGRLGTPAQAIVALARGMRLGNRPVQLVISVEMVDTVQRVLERLGFSSLAARTFGTSLIDLMKAGPESLDPYLLISGRDQIAMRDREDAGVLATAIAAKVNLLVTDNLTDFKTNDCEVVPTQVVKSGDGKRQLFVLIHERQDKVCVIVAHPIDVLAWIEHGVDISAEAIRQIKGP
jgi:predicted nucleic acid-binding protein